MDTAGPKQTDAADQPEKPKGMWPTILTMTPIILTVLATTFAGLSSSEMTKSMYFRSLAAQHQAKVGDEWAFFQAKRIRGSNLEATVDLLQSLAHPTPFNPSSLEAVVAELSKITPASSSSSDPSVAARILALQEKVKKLLVDPNTKRNLTYLTTSALPKGETVTVANAEVQKTLDALARSIGERKPENATTGLVAQLNFEDIDEAIRVAEENADNFDKACDPVNDMIKQIRSILRELAQVVQPLRQESAKAGAGKEANSRAVEQFDGLSAGFKSAAMDYDARRYRQESSLNRKAAELYEVRVRRSGLESDRHRERSIKFFYAMLLAQMGVTVASLALARQRHSWLWLVAAMAGISALTFSGYVFMTP